MNSETISWLLILEAVLPFAILSIILVMVIMAGRKKSKKAAKLLILNVKANEDNEKQAIVSFLVEKLALDEKSAKKKSKKIMNERKFLIRNLVSGLLDKNVEAISQLNQDLCRVSQHYHRLEVIAAPKVESEDQGMSEEEQEREASLKGEIKALKQELHITLTTLNNIFKEFSSMFGEDDIPDGEMSVDQIITAMESFSSSGESDDYDEDEELVSGESIIDEGLQEENVDDESGAGAETKALEETTEEIATVQIASESSELDKSEQEVLDFSVDAAIDDIDSALDELELDSSECEEGEPDWGDAFAESGDTMEEQPKE